MFSDIIVAIKPVAVEQHAAFIRRELNRLMPDACVRFVSRQEDIKKFDGVDLIISAQHPWLTNLLAVCPNVRWLHLLTAGSELIFQHGLERKGYLISKSSGVTSVAIAEYVVGALCYSAKKFDYFAKNQAARRWERAWLEELAGKTAVVLGMGAVGQAIAAACHAMGIRVIGVSKRGRVGLPQLAASISVEELNSVLPKARILVIAVPLTEESRGMIGRAELELLPSNAFLVNVSRGGVVQEDAFVSALKNGALGGAVVDVFEEEPLPESSVIWDCPNLLITPHVAGTSDNFMQKAMAVFEQNYAFMKTHGKLATPVDCLAGY